MKELLEIIPQIGEVVWIGIRPARRDTLKKMKNFQLSKDSGLEGDHYTGSSKKRQVTLIQYEHILAVSSILGKEVNPGQLRRNIVVKGINLLSLKEKRFQVGNDVILEYTGYCHPCSRMEENLGPGGYNAMRGHGGITAKIIQGGRVSLKDSVSFSKKI